MLRRRKITDAPTGEMKDIAAFRESLWATLNRNAAGLSGDQVVTALKLISDEIYDAGIDAAYPRARVNNRKNLADAWDLTWVTALSVELRRQQAAKKRSGRKNGKG